MSPDNLSDANLLAYMDGEAASDVVKRIEEDPQYLARIQELKQLENALHERLGALEKPSAEKLGEYQLGLLSKEETKAVEAYLKNRLDTAASGEEITLIIAQNSKGRMIKVDHFQIHHIYIYHQGGCQMPKYLFHGSYTAEGVKGLLKDGGSKRREVVQQGTQAMGGTLEAYYFAFGNNDFYGIVDLPDNVSQAAISLAVNASGTAQVSVTVLLTPEEIDAAIKMKPDYRPPGQ